MYISFQIRVTFPTLFQMKEFFLFLAFNIYFTFVWIWNAVVFFINIGFLFTFNSRTPIAYIASCHRFREQFTSILFGHLSFSRQIFQKLSPSGGEDRPAPGRTGQRTATIHRHLVTNHNNNHIGHRLIKPRPLASRVGGTSSSSRSTSLNSSGKGTRLGFSNSSALKTTSIKNSNPCQTVTKATTDIISTLSLHHFQHQTKLVLLEANCQSNSSSSSSSVVSALTHSNHSLISKHENKFSPLSSSHTLMLNLESLEQVIPVVSSSMTSTSSNITASSTTSINNGTSYNYPQLISYNYSPSGSMSEIYGQKV